MHLVRISGHWSVRMGRSEPIRRGTCTSGPTTSHRHSPATMTTRNSARASCSSSSHTRRRPSRTRWRSHAGGAWTKRYGNGASKRSPRTSLCSPVQYRVVALGEIPENGGVLAVAGDVEVGVFRVKGRLVAYENRCMHQGGPVCTGEIVGRYEQVLNSDGTVGGERFDETEPHLVCRLLLEKKNTQQQDELLPRGIIR